MYSNTAEKILEFRIEAANKATATHNFKWVQINHICLIEDLFFAT